MAQLTTRPSEENLKKLTSIKTPTLVIQGIEGGARAVSKLNKAGPFQDKSFYAIDEEDKKNNRYTFKLITKS